MDDPKKKEQDAKLVSSQDHEIKYLMEKFNIPHELVMEAKKAVGVSRKKIEDYIKQKLQ